MYEPCEMRHAEGALRAWALVQRPGRLRRGAAWRSRSPRWRSRSALPSPGRARSAAASGYAGPTPAQMCTIFKVVKATLKTQRNRLGPMTGAAAWFGVASSGNLMCMCSTYSPGELSGEGAYVSKVGFTSALTTASRPAGWKMDAQGL